MVFLLKKAFNGNPLENATRTYIMASELAQLELKLKIAQELTKQMEADAKQKIKQIEEDTNMKRVQIIVEGDIKKARLTLPEPGSKTHTDSWVQAWKQRILSAPYQLYQNEFEAYWGDEKNIKLSNLTEMLASLRTIVCSEPSLQFKLVEILHKFFHEGASRVQDTHTNRYLLGLKPDFSVFPDSLTIPSAAQIQTLGELRCTSDMNISQQHYGQAMANVRVALGCQPWRSQSLSCFVITQGLLSVVIGEVIPSQVSSVPSSLIYTYFDPMTLSSNQAVYLLHHWLHCKDECKLPQSFTDENKDNSRAFSLKDVQAIAAARNSNVYSFQTQNDEMFVCKMVVKEDTFKKEIAALVRLKGVPHVIQLIGVNFPQTSLFFRNLGLPLHLTVPSTITRSVFCVMVETLQEVHRLKVFHCDIRPHNIVLQVDGVVTLIDFGLALCDAMVKSGYEGSPLYSPNAHYVVNCTQQYSEATDLESLVKTWMILALSPAARSVLLYASTEDTLEATFSQLKPAWDELEKATPPLAQALQYARETKYQELQTVMRTTPWFLE